MRDLFTTLYQLRTTRETNCIEDYLTEILARCLQHYPEFRSAFFKTYLPGVTIENNGFVRTQMTFSGLREAPFYHEVESRPDMVYLEDNLRVFFEHKVDSQEGIDQLSRYAEHLSQERVNTKVLVYLSRNYDPKSCKDIVTNCPDSNIEFVQIRWFQVSRTAKQFLHIPLIEEFYQCLNHFKLTMNNKFTPEDILALSHFSNVKSLMDETLWGDIASRFKEVNCAICQQSTSMNQIREHDRYIMYADHQDGFWVALGFWFNSSSDTYPEFGVMMQCDPRNKKSSEKIRETFKEILKVRKENSWKGMFLTDSTKWAHLYKRKGINEILSHDDQVAIIKEFFTQCIAELEEILVSFSLPLNANCQKRIKQLSTSN